MLTSAVHSQPALSRVTKNLKEECTADSMQCIMRNIMHHTAQPLSGATSARITAHHSATRTERLLYM